MQTKRNCDDTVFFGVRLFEGVISVSVDAWPRPQHTTGEASVCPTREQSSPSRSSRLSKIVFWLDEKVLKNCALDPARALL